MPIFFFRGKTATDMALRLVEIQYFSYLLSAKEGLMWQRRSVISLCTVDFDTPNFFALCRTVAFVSMILLRFPLPALRYNPSREKASEDAVFTVYAEAFRNYVDNICRSYSSTTSSTSIGQAFAQYTGRRRDISDAGVENSSAFTIRPNGTCLLRRHHSRYIFSC